MIMEIYNGTHCVYVHINKANGKMYIGQTVYGDNPNKRWHYGLGYATQKYFYRAIQKYGWDGFVHEIIASNLTKEEADNFEILLIKELKTYDKRFGYNVTLGGGGNLGFKPTEESIEKQKRSMRKYFDNPEYIQKMRDVAPKRPIYQFTLDGILIQYYESAMEAERQTGISNREIFKSVYGQLPSVKGYIFLFEEDIDSIEQRVERYVLSKKPRHENIVQLSLDGNYIKQWNGSADAGRTLGINYKNINAVCHGKKKTAGGYKWMFISDYEKSNQN